MPIVDFQQDPAESFGTGNFRDDQGRVMYLHDPETAAQFNKTIPGASLGKKIAQESQDILDARTQPGAQLGPRVGMEADAIAQSVMPKPQAGPDLRVAGPGGEAPDESSVSSPGAALIENLQSVTTPPAAAAPPPVAGAAPVTPAAPPAPGAPPAGAGAALVQGVSDFDARIAERSKERPIEMPKPKPSGSLPLHGTRSAEGASIDEGRPIENVVEQARDEDVSFKTNVEKPILEQGRAKDRAVQSSMLGEMRGQQSLYGQSVDTVFRKSAERREAERKLETITAELKKNDESLDPDRYMKQMSTGKRIAMIILAALNGGFGSLIGAKSNGVIDVLNAQIDKDFERQKLEVANKKTTLGNEYKRLLDLGLTAKEAEDVWRDRAAKALFGFKDLEKKRAEAAGAHANEREAEVLLAPLRQAQVQRQGDLLASAEDRVKRTRDESISHEVPPPQLLSPQDVLAMMAIANQKIANANTADVEAAVGHPVTPEESAAYRKDAQEYGKRLAVIASTRAQIKAVADKVGLFKGKSGYEGSADPGVRPLGTSAFDQHARDVDREYALLKRADIMQMVREPSAPLQNEFGQITARPFNDSDIPIQLNTMDRLLQQAEEELRAGFSDEALSLYKIRTNAGTAAPAPGRSAAPTAGKRAAPSPAQRAAAAEQKRTQDMMNAPGGDLRSE